MVSKVVRQCGTIEHWSTSRHAIGIYTGIANSCRYVASERSSQTLVEAALARAILRLGGLRVGIINEDTNQASFVSVPSMDLRDFIEWETVKEGNQAQFDARVLEVTKNRLEQLWPDVAIRPPWKLLVVQNCTKDWGQVRLDMVFVTHHALADGKSTMVFHNELLRELNQNPTDRGSGPPPELKGHILSFDRPPVLAPPQQELIEFWIGWIFFFKTLWKEFGPSWLKPTPPVEPWAGKAITLEPHRLNLRLISIEEEVVPKLVTACRAHGATLTAILHVLVLASVARRVPAEVAPAFSSETPIGLVPWAKSPPGSDVDLTKTLSVLNTSSNKVWDVETVADLRRRINEEDQGLEEDLVWPLAATWRAEMKAKLASLPNDDVCGLMDYVTDWQKRWEGKIGKQRDATWEVSNIGLIKANPEWGYHTLNVWDIRRSFFTQPAFLAGPGFGVNVTGVEGGEVTLTLNWQGGVIDDTIVDGVVEDLSSWLDKFRMNGSFGIVESKR